MAVKISAGAGYLPERTVTNDELASIMETSDEWIQSHTGIVTRHFAIGENTSDMAAKVAVRLMENAGVKPEEVDLIIVSTISPDSITPSTAALVQGKTGCVNAFAYDISAACAGFIFALSTAEKFLRCGQYHKAIVISAETNSKMMDFRDRTSAVFFGDGAAGVLLETSDDQADECFIAEELHASGNAEVIHSGRIEPIRSISPDNYPHVDAFYQDGRSVYNFVTNEITAHMKSFLDRQGVSPSDLGLVITHQANLRLIENIASALGISLDRFQINVQTAGNTSSVGIPLALSEALAQGKHPSRCLLTGFGAGLAYGSVLIDLEGVRSSAYEP